MTIFLFCMRNWKLIAAGVAALALISAGIWFRGVLADRKELAVQNKAQAQQVKDLSGEIERMNKQDAQDFALFENVEAQKKIHAAEILKQSAALRKAKELLNEATKNCFDVVLPDSYIKLLLPKAKH